MKINTTLCLATLVSSMLASTASAQIYFESFVGATASPVDSVVIEDYGGFTAFLNDGTDLSATGVDPFRINVANDNDYVFIGSGATNLGDQYALISGAGTIDPTAYQNDLAFSFNSFSTDATAPSKEMGWRFFATVGSTIYASDLFAITSATSLKSITVSDSVWNIWDGETDLTDGFAIADIGATVTGTTLAAGNITNIGVLAIDGGSGNDRMRFEDFTISGTAVPEPSSYALLAGMFGLACVMLRRRK